MKQSSRVGVLVETRRTPTLQWILVALLLGAAVAGTSSLRAQAPQLQQPLKLPPLEMLQRAHTFFVQGDYENARNYYLEILPAFPRDFDILKNLAYCYYVTGPRGYGQAASYYARAYAINPRSSDVADNLSKCYMTLKRYEEAAAVEQKLAALPGAPAEAWKRVAEAYEAARNIPQAVLAYNAYIQRNPGDLQARSDLGRLYSWNRAYGQALEQYRIVLSANPNFSPALIGMARLLSWQGQLEESLRLYNHVLHLKPNNGEAQSGKAFVLLWIGRAQEAQELFTKLHHRYPQDNEVARGLEAAETAVQEQAFAAARKAGNTSQIEAYYRQRVAKNPGDLTALKALMALNNDPKHCNERVAFGRKALEVSQGGDPEIELSLARSLAACQQYAEGIARYRRYLSSHPQAEGALHDLGEILLRDRRMAEAIEVFRSLLQQRAEDIDAQVGLARGLAATGQYDEALLRFDQALKRSPHNYDALQGKAYILFWKNDFAQARAIFQRLAEIMPTDPQNDQSLRDIAQAEEEARWAALRPASDAPPQALLAYYLKRLASYPDDQSAMKGLAYVQAQLKNVPAAIRGYRRVLELFPDDRDAKLELARLLSLDKQYSASISLYREVLKLTLDNPAVLDNLARVYVWAGQSREALQIYQGLLAANPANAGYQLEVARLESRLKEYPAARNVLASLLAADPQNREARLELAHINLTQGRYDASLKDFEYLLNHDPQDTDALLGKAQNSYYQGHLSQADYAAAKVVEKRPNDFTAVYLLASIQHARHHRRRTLELLDQAEKLSPGNPEVAALRRQVKSESAVTIHTSSSFAREIGPPGQFGARKGLPNEDLRTFSHGMTIGLSVLPKTDSYLSFTSMPSASPPGPFRDDRGNQIPTGITGTVAPAQFLYRQSTSISSRLTVRGGFGLVRFGPGQLVSLPGQPARVSSATIRLLASAGLSFNFTKRLGFDLDANRSAITYTPTSVHLGVVQNELRTGLNYIFGPRAELHLHYWSGRYSSQEYDHVIFLKGTPVVDHKADHDQGHGLSIVFNGKVFHSNRFSLDGGYQGVAFGFAGSRQHVFMGFFNPSLYQRHEFTPRIYGKLWGPLGYDCSGGIGIQKSGQGQPVTRGLDLSPSFSVQVSKRFVVTLGYTYYNTAQALGPLRGNAVRFQTDWRF